MAQVKKPNFNGTEGQWVGYKGNNFLYTKGKWVQTDENMNPIDAATISNQLDSSFWTSVVNQGGGLLNGLLSGDFKNPNAPNAPELLDDTTAPPEKSNTFLYIGIAVVALIGIVFFLKRKKSPEA